MLELRVIFDKDPATAGERFFDLIAYGGIEEFLPNGKGIKVSMADGTIITFRPKTKSDNYPGVTINVIKSKKHGDLKDQKIHFEKDKNK